MRNIRRALKIVLLLIGGRLLAIFQPAAATSLTVAVDEQQGLPLIRNGIGDAVKNSYAFWGANWRWASQDTTMKVVGAFDYALAGKNAGLEFDIDGRAYNSGQKQLIWELDINTRKEWANVIGGGIVFKFDLGLGKGLGAPQLLNGNRGWLWGQKDRGGSRIELAISAPPGLKLYPARAVGPDAERITAPYVNGKYKIALTPLLKTYWLQLRQ